MTTVILLNMTTVILLNKITVILNEVKDLFNEKNKSLKHNKLWQRQ